MRGDLCRLMYDATKDRARYAFGTSVESFEDKKDGVEVRFGDGKTGVFDLWVGADGVSSRTRKLMLGPDVPDGFHPLGESTLCTSPSPSLSKRGKSTSPQHTLRLGDGA